MDGDTLYRWNKAIWAAAFGLMAFLVFQLIIRPGNDFTETSTTTNSGGRCGRCSGDDAETSAVEGVDQSG